MKDAKCKICRRAGRKLFLKGEKCFSPKCPMIKKAYPPGAIKKRRGRPLSEYGKELREKQKLRKWYGLAEKQFSKYVKEVLDRIHSASSLTENPAETLIRRLETRLDNVVFRLGFAVNRAQARQMVSHRHFLVNGKPVNIPSFNLKKGDKISVRASSQKKEAFQKLSASLKKYQAPSWLDLDKGKAEGAVIALPTLEEVAPPAEISSIFEFYSR
jgi:small subunit ribosomal protein S4